MRDRLLTAVKVLISLALIVYLFSRVDLAEVGHTLVSARPGYFLLALVLYLGAVILNAVRWQVLLRAQRIIVPLRALLEYTFVGVFFNNFLPANVGGDVMRGYGLARYTDRAAEAAVSVLVDRIVGLSAFMSSAAVAALIAVRSTGQEDLRQLALAAGVALALVSLGFLLLLSRRVRAWLERLFRWHLLQRLAPLYDRLSDAFDAYRDSTGALALAFAIALGIVLLTNLVNWSLAEAVGGGISLLHISIFNPLIAFVLMIPISIGGLGLSQNAYVFFFRMVEVPEQQALAVSLLLQFIVYIASLPGGVLWWRGRRSQRT
jgi:uncharacterized protein (TIRG00374 family)